MSITERDGARVAEATAQMADSLGALDAHLERIAVALEALAADAGRRQAQETRAIAARHQALQDQMRQAAASFRAWDSRAIREGQRLGSWEREQHRRTENEANRAERDLAEFEAAHPELREGGPA